jgi:Tn3 transposase DDE domain
VLRSGTAGYPATEALDRFGSAGDPVYETGTALGKLLRTLYLCDYLSNPVIPHGNS